MSVRKADPIDISRSKRGVPFPPHGGVISHADVARMHEVLLDLADGRDTLFPYPHQQQFESALKRVTGPCEVVPLSSCGTGLDAALALLDIGPGDEVVTTGLTFASTAGAVLLRGAKVRFADIDPRTLNLDPKAVRRAISPCTKAIVPVHFAGLMCDVDAFERLSRETGIPVIYDAAHALGATTSDGRPLKDFGLANVLSFQFNKHVTCLGEGGALLTRDRAFAQRVNEFKSFGFRYPRIDTFDGGVVETLGTNFQMTKLQFVAGAGQLDRFPALLAMRQKAFRKMHALLEAMRGIRLHSTNASGHASLIFAVRVLPEIAVRSGADVRGALEASGIGTRHHYTPVWDWPMFRRLGYSGIDCPHTVAVAENLISLPISQATTDTDCDTIAEALHLALSSRRVHAVADQVLGTLA